MKAKKKKVWGFINEHHADAVRYTFGDKIADALQNASEGKTFLQVLIEQGCFDPRNG